MKQAVILAGGQGTRLKERLNGLPKPLIDICGVPLLERQILLCKQHGFTDILILVNYAAEQIRQFYASRNNWGLTVTCIDDGQPRGTAGAVLAVLDACADEFLVLYGDTMLAVDLDRFWSFHKASQADGSLFVHPNDHPHDSDLVVAHEDDTIKAFRPYPHPADGYEPNLVNAALYILNKKALQPWVDQAVPLDFAKDLFPRMLQNGQKLAAYNSPEYIKDCGTPQRLDKVCADFASGRIERASLNHQQRAVFLDRDGTINHDRGYITRPEDFEMIAGVEAAVRRLNHSDYRAVVVTNQPIIARGDCSVEELHTIHNKMETLLGKGHAYLDRIYYCPHYPQAGFSGEIAALKIACDCRKPKTGMVTAAQKDLNIDPTQSWVVGDSTVDLRMGTDVGATTILVETGHAGRDGKTIASPNFIMPDLPAAVDFILDEYPKQRAWADHYSQELHAGNIVLIGGTARSGKTTIAECLHLSLRDRGIASVVLSLDRWILSKDQRKDTVLGRYDVDAIHKTLHAIATRQSDLSLNLPRYNKWDQTQSPDPIPWTCSKDAIVIIEGTIALSFCDRMPTDKCHTIAIETNETLRQLRFMQDYAKRGHTETESAALYQSRMHDEVPLLNNLTPLASIILKLPLA